ncbi:hypothetical protein BXZ70DRAFT_79682 [Cristinia sonorae]|uniref:Uncharacterized protein n=1 Tax=Cristinia sonorae TaxID=1940300 RepID=A0A8K0UQR0_9AGAR|nr:hypothetical protein BXZ70DRAFT_79682 [Cristinia sonorae]
MVQLIKTVLVSLFFGVASFVAAAPSPESAVQPAIEAARFNHSAEAMEYVAKRNEFKTERLYFDYTIKHPNGSTTVILRHKTQNGNIPLPLFPVWNSYFKVDYDTKNKVVAYEDRWWGPSWFTDYGYENEEKLPLSRFQGEIDEVTKKYNATLVSIPGHGDKVYGYFGPAEIGEYAICTVFHLKRKSDGAILTWYYNIYNLVYWIGVKDTPWIL